MTKQLEGRAKLITGGGTGIGRASARGAATHEGRNQAPPRVGLDEFADNLPLVEGVERHDAAWALERLHDAGRLVGTEEYQSWAEQAHRFPPELHTHDRYGHRLDEVRYNPA
jgi:putative acyl-CoA dehydrogenase